MDAEIEKLLAMLEEAETSLRKHGNSLGLTGSRRTGR
jgi:hypothetical protein